MRTFKRFSQEIICPICGENTGKECTLIPIDGTSDGKISEAIPVHVECLADGKWRYNQQLGVIYRRV